MRSTRLGALPAVVVLTALIGGARPAVGQQEEARDSHSDSTPGGATAPGDAGRRPDLSQVAKEIVRLTNEFRAEQGREKVRANKKLEAAAQYFAEYMARTGRYGHTADGSRPSQRAEKHGYEYCLVSENIASQYNSAGFEAEELSKAFTDGWINSPGHRKNMLEPAVVDTGVAVARSESGTYYAVQMFGRPESMRIQFTIKNESEMPVRYTVGGETFSLAPRVTRTHARAVPGAGIAVRGGRRKDVLPGEGRTLRRRPRWGRGVGSDPRRQRQQTVGAVTMANGASDDGRRNDPDAVDERLRRSPLTHNELDPADESQNAADVTRADGAGGGEPPARPCGTLRQDLMKEEADQMGTHPG